MLLPSQLHDPEGLDLVIDDLAKFKPKFGRLLQNYMQLSFASAHKHRFINAGRNVARKISYSQDARIGTTVKIKNPFTFRDEDTSVHQLTIEKHADPNKKILTKWLIDNKGHHTVDPLMSEESIQNLVQINPRKLQDKALIAALHYTKSDSNHPIVHIGFIGSILLASWLADKQRAPGFDRYFIHEDEIIKQISAAIKQTADINPRKKVHVMVSGHSLEVPTPKQHSTLFKGPWLVP